MVIKWTISSVEIKYDNHVLYHINPTLKHLMLTLYTINTITHHVLDINLLNMNEITKTNVSYLVKVEWSVHSCVNL